MRHLDCCLDGVFMDTGPGTRSLPSQQGYACNHRVRRDHCRPEFAKMKARVARLLLPLVCSGWVVLRCGLPTASADTHDSR